MLVLALHFSLLYSHANVSSVKVSELIASDLFYFFISAVCCLVAWYTSEE